MYYIINLSSWKFVLYLQNVNFLDIYLSPQCLILYGHFTSLGHIFVAQQSFCWPRETASSKHFPLPSAYYVPGIQ